MNEIISLLNSHFEENQDEILEEFFSYLRFQSISTDSQYKEELTKCADWVKDYLSGLDFNVETWVESGSNPCIFAEKIVDPNAPTVLFYNHYDVQPADPLELWDTPPFEPAVRNGEIYARGAEDNKGQSYYVLRTLKALHESSKTPPVNIKLLIEGEEECGSKNLPLILKKYSSKLKADYLFVVDFGFHAPDRPAISLGCRGVVSMTLTASGSNTDLHSGEHGGIVFNPLHALVEVLGKMRSPETGEIRIPGFYDNLRDLTDSEKSDFSLELDTENYNKLFAAETCGGEKKLSPLERAWLRPTLEINGLRGGYSGEGFKTVIPAKAIAKLSSRIVPDQDPQKVVAAIKSFIEANTPEGINIEVSDVTDDGEPFRTSPNTKGAQFARDAYEEVLGIPCKNILAGGSIPIVASLVRTSEAEPVLMGYGLPDDNIHAPNEHFGIDRLKKGMATIGVILQKTLLE